MRTILAVPIALALLTSGVWAKDLQVSATLRGVLKLCGGNEACNNVQCGSATCDGSCNADKTRTITIHRSGPTRPT